MEFRICPWLRQTHARWISHSLGECPLSSGYGMIISPQPPVVKELRGNNRGNYGRIIRFQDSSLAMRRSRSLSASACVISGNRPKWAMNSEWISAQSAQWQLSLVMRSFCHARGGESRTILIYSHD